MTVSMPQGQAIRERRRESSTKTIAPYAGMLDWSPSRILYLVVFTAAGILVHEDTTSFGDASELLCLQPY